MGDYTKYDLLKGGESKFQSNLEELREQFTSKYCTKRGWEESKLTIEQLNEIHSQKEYTNPNIILG